jgi:predicted MFS family arabinose efflux permease
MPARLRWYVGAVGIAGLLVLAWLLPTLDLDRSREVGGAIALFACFVVGGELVSLRLLQNNRVKDLAVTTTFAYGLVLLAGTAVAGSFLPWAASAVLLGAGTAMVYPTLLAAISDVAHPSWRATAVGVYRLWRDTGFAVGALLAGLVADLAGLVAAVWVVAALTAASGAVVAVRMYETHPSAART